MLILSRKQGESITIGDDIVVTVVSVSGNQIRLGIQAPREVRVLREEIYRAVGEENRAAAHTLDSRRLEDAFREFRDKAQQKTHG